MDRCASMAVSRFPLMASHAAFSASRSALISSVKPGVSMRSPRWNLAYRVNEVSEIRCIYGEAPALHTEERGC